MTQKPKRLEKFLSPAARSDTEMMPFSLVGRGRLELPTNGLKARCAEGAV
jgi:hypothetical protein